LFSGNNLEEEWQQPEVEVAQRASLEWKLLDPVTSQCGEPNEMGMPTQVNIITNMTEAMCEP